MGKQVSKKQCVYVVSIIGLIVCLIFVSIVANQVIAKQSSKPEIVMFTSEDVEEPIGSFILYTDDVMQVKVLDSLTSENSTIRYSENDKTKPTEYYAIRKVELLADSLDGLKKGSQIEIREQVARNDQNQIFQMKDNPMLEKGKRYSLMIKHSQGQLPSIIPSKYALKSYTQMRGSDVDDTRALLVHTLYAKSRLTTTQIKMIATSIKVEGVLNLAIEMEQYAFNSLNDQATQFAYGYSESVDTTYVEYQNCMYKVNGNLMNM